MGEDFNYTLVLDDIINNSIESTEQVSSDFSTESNAISGFLIFLFILLLMIIVIASAIGGMMSIMNPK